MAFLDRFKSLGCFLVDLCSEPVNGMSRSERRKCHLAGEKALAAELEKLRPRAVIVVIKGITESVDRAMVVAKLKVPRFILPFPSHGHDREYVSGLSEIVAQRAAAKVLRK